MSILYLALIGFTSLLVHVTSTPIIKAPWGSIQGVEVQGRGRQKDERVSGYSVCRAPYRQTPLAETAAHPGPGDGKVFVATSLLPACSQELPGIGVYNGTSEDCLTLNVFVPIGGDVTSGALKPVMVWIHGGGFIMGDAASFRPTKLVADNDVIVVTIQYRLGVFGFLSTGDATAPGNYGLWDQRLALVWVKENIRAFGGDPDLVTIFGESAGGMSVGFHVISPVSTGLFKRAIAQSGSPYLLSCFADKAAMDFRNLAVAVGCVSEAEVARTSSSELLDCLKGVASDELINKTLAMSRETMFALPFSVRADGEFLADTPGRLIEDEGRMALAGAGEVDILMGFNNKEGSLLLLLTHLFSGLTVEGLQSTAFFRGFLQLSTSCINNGQPSVLAAKALEFFYREFDAFTEKPVSLERFMELYADTMFTVHAVRWIRQLVTQPHTARRYLYFFDHDLSFNQGGPAPGMHHGDDVLFEFEPISESFALVGKTGPFTPEEEKLSSDFLALLTDFARTGNPSASLGVRLGGDFSEYTLEDEAYISVSTNISVQHHVMRKRVAVWLQLLPELLAASSPPAQQRSTATDQVKDEF
ncbi:cholinesterase 2-like isoform X2 [Pomacea canaliculata]|uniref:cholinesterase 2-like isoform X2 n=1 Tax=Pomacea canaliculata TaxID=400727 RepID=UPI000D73DE2B|nr:cholinesterase 2-like isoform X2 [Pomacea canaliculata]